MTDPTIDALEHCFDELLSPQNANSADAKDNESIQDMHTTTPPQEEATRWKLKEKDFLDLQQQSLIWDMNLIYDLFCLHHWTLMVSRI